MIHLINHDPLLSPTYAAFIGKTYQYLYQQYWLCIYLVLDLYPNLQYCIA